MADVRMPDGTVIRNVPDGTTKAELMARVAKMRGEPTPPRGIKQTFAGPPGPTFTDELSARLSLPGDRGHSVDLDRKMFREVAQEAEAIQNETPFLERMNARFQPGQLAPLLGLGAGAMVPGAGWGSLLLGSALSGGVTALGDMARQNVRGDVDVTQALKTGAKEGAANFAGGAVLKGLGATAKALFHSPLDESAKAAAQFARENKVPFPPSSAMPGSRAGRIEQGTRVALAGDIKTQLDANKVTQFLNNNVGRMTEKAQVFDEAARNGQQFLREVFEPGETAYKSLFENYAKAVGGRETPIPTAHTLSAIKEASEALKRRGITSGALAQKLNTILKQGPQTYSVREFDSLHGELTKLIKGTSYDDVQGVLSGITKDMDAVGKMAGVNFGEEMARTLKVREQFKDLKDIPQFQRLAAEIGDRQRGGTAGTNDWMNSLFSSGNGKALGKLRELNPELYHDLADAWLAKQIQGFSKIPEGGVVPVLNGAGMRTWFEQNQGKIKEIYGAPQAKALDNFTLYAKHMTGAVKRSVEGKTFDPVNIFGRLAGGGATGYLANPSIVLAGEPAAFLLARGLADPNSALFRMFTEGFSPATRSFVIKSGQLGAQAASKKANGEDSR